MGPGGSSLLWPPEVVLYRIFDDKIRPLRAMEVWRGAILWHPCEVFPLTSDLTIYGGSADLTIFGDCY